MRGIAMSVVGFQGFCYWSESVAWYCSVRGSQVFCYCSESVAWYCNVRGRVSGFLLLLGVGCVVLQCPWWGFSLLEPGVECGEEEEEEEEAAEEDEFTDQLKSYRKRYIDS